MSSDRMQIAGVAYNYHNSYRTKLMATKVAKQLSKQGWKVRIMKSEAFEHLRGVLHTFSNYDVWKTKH